MITLKNTYNTKKKQKNNTQNTTLLQMKKKVFLCVCLYFFIFFVIDKMINRLNKNMFIGFAPIFPDTCYHLTHYWPAAADIPVASDNPVHYADAIRYNARTPLQGSLLPLTHLV